MTMLDKAFPAVLQRSPNRGGWTYVVMPGSASTSALAAWSVSAAASTATIPRVVHGAR